MSAGRLTADDYDALGPGGQRFLEAWLTEHAGIPFDEERWIVDVELDEGQITIYRANDHPTAEESAWELEHCEVFLHPTVYPSHRPPPVWKPIGLPESSRP